MMRKLASTSENRSQARSRTLNDCSLVVIEADEIQISRCLSHVCTGTAPMRWKNARFKIKSRSRAAMRSLLTSGLQGIIWRGVVGKADHNVGAVSMQRSIGGDMSPSKISKNDSGFDPSRF